MDERVPYLNWKQPQEDSEAINDWEEELRLLMDCRHRLGDLEIGTWDRRGIYFWAQGVRKTYGVARMAACAAARIQLAGQDGEVSPEAREWAVRYPFAMPEGRAEIAAPVRLSLLNDFVGEFVKIKRGYAAFKASLGR